ncbi:MAG: TrkH family potassium uptake protein [Lachnospiraceae bacterium]|nr:TrkH family potassium uptake protein [Lachnospiraceae bacterium]
MNYSIILYILGWVLKLEGAFMLLPLGVSLIYREEGAYYFAVIGVVCALLGYLLSFKKVKNQNFYAREGFVVVALSWIVMSIMGCLPFYISGEIPKFTDALFETVSGFTTTGASILTDVEALSHGMQFWRCFTHWIGGMGVLVFMIALLPSVGGQNIFLMRAESPGPTVGRLEPRIQQTAKVLYVLYFVLTAAEFVLLLLAGMPVYEAICTAFGTAGTGGFGVMGDSMASYSTAIQVIVTVFMLMFGVNFNFYFYLVVRKWKDAFHMEEVRAYLLIFVAATALIAVNLLDISKNFLYNLQQAAFQVASIVTTTGYATADFDQWPELSRMILVLLMFIGGCAGSTGGSVKVSRHLISLKRLKKEFERLTHPKSVKALKMDGKPISNDVVHSTMTFIYAFLLIFVASVLLISLDNFDFATNFTAVAATIGNVGPGLSLVGPTANYSIFSTFSKYVLMFDMLAGRLELFPLLLLFLPGTWRRR